MVRSKCILRACTTAAVLTLGSAPALAGTGPDLFINVHVSDGISTLFDSGQVNLNNEGAPIGPFFQYTPGAAAGLNTDANLFSLSGNITTQPTLGGIGPVILSPNLHVVNDSAQVLQFLITITMPFASPFDLSWTSNSAWTLGGGPNPELFTVGADSLWQVMADGSDLGSQYDAPSGMGSSGGDLSLTTTPISGPLSAVNNSVSIQIMFESTAGSDSGINGSFAIIPVPAALGLFGIAGLATRRRRRN